MGKKTPKSVPAAQPSNDGNFTVSQLRQIENSFDGLLGMLGGNGAPSFQQISQTGTLYINLRWYLISNNRQLLSQTYVEHGIVQTLIDQPVDDGFRTGFDIHSHQLDAGEIEELANFAEQNQVIASVMQAIKWARLFGGGALIFINGQDPSTPLKSENLKENEPFRFKAIDMWELYNSIMNVSAETTLVLDDSVEYFDYYGIKVHRSRVFLIKGKEAPSFVRPRLRGWGMSEVERLIRSINSYLKNQDVVFELLDEAKIDVFKMKGFNAALLQEGGTAKVARRVQGANQIKNFQHALTMDKEDEYEQKQISFSGLGDILTQIRQGVAADVKMPMTKLFGISAAGFSSGEDDIENYNSMIDSEVRAKSKFIIVSVLQICCQIKFGFIPDDLKIVWKPLRILNAKEEEEVKTSKFNRIMSAYQAGLASAQEAKESINKDALVPVELDETTEALPPLAGEYTVEGEAKGTGGKQAKAEA